MQMICLHKPPALVFVAECTRCILIKRYAYRALPRLTFKYSKNCDNYDLSEATPLSRGYNHLIKRIQYLELRGLLDSTILLPYIPSLRVCQLLIRRSHKIFKKPSIIETTTIGKEHYKMKWMPYRKIKLHQFHRTLRFQRRHG